MSLEILQNQDCNSDELQRMQEVVEQYPDGLFIYFCYDAVRRAQIQYKLQKEFTNHLIIVTPNGYPYPADLGTQVGDKFYCFSFGEEEILKVITKSIGVSKESASAFLPTFVSEGEVIGGKNVEIAGSDIVLTTNEFSADEGARGFRYLPVLTEALKDLYMNPNGLYHPDHSGLYSGHPDLVLSGVKTTNGVSLYVDEILHGKLGERLFVNDILRQAQAVDHGLVARGGLNLKYVGDVALVPIKEVVDSSLLGDLESIGMRVVELGAHQFQLDRRAGVKCRSLPMNWPSWVRRDLGLE